MSQSWLFFLILLSSYSCFSKKSPRKLARNPIAPKAEEVAQNIQDFIKICENPENAELKTTLARLQLPEETCKKTADRIAKSSILDLSVNEALPGSEKLQLNESQVQKIVDVRPIKYFVNLETLLLQNNNISDYSPLSELVNLKSLNLRGNPVTIAVKIPALELIDLSHTPVLDFNPLLEEASQLKELYLNDSVPLETVKAIREKHPNLIVYRFACSTLDSCNKEVLVGGDEFDARGFNKSGIHKNTTPFDDHGFDKDGYDRLGFNSIGLRRDGSRFASNGLDFQGYNAQGFNNARLHRNSTGYDDDGYNADGFNRRGFNRQRKQRDGSHYDSAGFDFAGFDRHGFNSSGQRSNGSYFDDQGYDRDGYDRNGYNRQNINRQGIDRQGILRQGTHQVNRDLEGYNQHGRNQANQDREGYNQHGRNQANRDREGYDQHGHNEHGLDREGFDQQGYNNLGFNRRGFDRQGFNAAGFDQYGFNEHGFDEHGYNRRGFNAAHIHRETTTAYDRNGYDFEGYNDRGFNSANVRRNGSQYDTAGLDAFGFDGDGVDILGLNTPAAKTFREERVASLMADLETMGYPLYDALINDSNIAHNLDALKLALAGHTLGDGATLTALPSDKDIHNDLLKTKKTLRTWLDRGYRLADLASYHQAPAKVSKMGKFLDFDGLWRGLGVTSHNDFYMTIYNELNHANLLTDARFPDPSDAALNILVGDNPLQRQRKIDTKRDYLILALASLKNPTNNKMLARREGGRPAIEVAHLPEATLRPLSTENHHRQWIGEMRYRLYKISEKVSTMSPAEKTTLLSQLMHAGAHCSNAKRLQFTQAMTLFNPEASTQLNVLEWNLATNLEERIEMLATRKKAKLLQDAIDTAFERAIDLPFTWAHIGDGTAPLWAGGFSDREDVIKQKLLYKFNTWNRHILNFGLQELVSIISTGVPLEDRSKFLKFEHGEADVLAAYTPAALLAEVRHDQATSKETLNMFLGSMQYVFRQPEHVYLGALLQYGFFE